MTAASSYPRVPGPANREDFFAQQRRYRRKTWQLTSLCALGVLLMGIPLSVVISPLVWAAATIGADLMNLVVRTPDAGSAVFQVLDRVLGTSGPTPMNAMATLSAALVLPGVLAIGAAWTGLRLLMRHDGAETVAVELGARAPSDTDFEEHQLANVVEEMAMAAGVRPPRVRLLDTQAVNAGAVGASHDDAIVLVSRGLLEQLDRDETQAVLAHVIGSIGNGDLPASLTMIQMAEALGLVSTLLGAPISRRARAAFAELARLAFVRRGDTESRRRRLRALLALATGDAGADESGSGRTRLRDVLTLPFLMAQAAFWINERIFVGLAVGPPLAYMWRARRYLADATAVQLTRAPDALARALVHLAAQDDAIPGAAWCAHLFVIGRNAARGRGGSGGEAGADAVGSILPFDPPLARRLDHLRAAGATIQSPARPPRSPAATALLVAIGGPLLALIVLLLGTVAVLLVYVALAIDMLFLLPVAGGLHVLLRWLAR